MVEIALSPLQDARAALRGGGHPRHRRLPAREAGAAARALRRVRGAGRAAGGRHARSRRCCWRRCPPWLPRPCRSRPAASTCWRRRRRSRVAAGRRAWLAGGRSATACRTATTRRRRFVLAQGARGVDRRPASRARFEVPAAYRDGWSARWRCRCPTAAAPSACWRCARATPQRFGDDEVHFLESLSNLLATSPAARAERRGAAAMRSGWRASASSPAASRTTSTTC